MMESTYIFKQDTAKAAQLTAEANRRCELINESYSRLRERGHVKEMTPAVMEAILLNDPTPIIQQSIAGLQAEADRMRSNAARVDYMESASKRVKQDINKEFTRTYEDASKYRAMLRHYPLQIAPYIVVSNDRATVNDEAITSDCTRRATPAQTAFIEEARELAQRIVEFDARTRILSGGNVRFIDDSDLYGHTLCVVNGGKLYFDRVGVLDIDPTPENEKRLRDAWSSVIDNFKDCNQYG